MRTPHRYAFLLLALSAAGLGSEGCSTPSGNTSACTVTPFISPTTATLDHTVAGNSQTFTTGYQYAGKCAIPAVLAAYTWQVSDTIDASVTSAPGPSGTVTCNAAALNPITVYTTIAGYTAGSSTPIYTPTGLPSATLICK